MSVCQSCPASVIPIGSPFSMILDRIPTSARPGSWCRPLSVAWIWPKRREKSRSATASRRCAGEAQHAVAAEGERMSAKSAALTRSGRDRRRGPSRPGSGRSARWPSSSSPHGLPIIPRARFAADPEPARRRGFKKVRRRQRPAVARPPSLARWALPGGEASNPEIRASASEPSLACDRGRQRIVWAFFSRRPLRARSGRRPRRGRSRSRRTRRPRRGKGCSRRPPAACPVA